MNMSETTKLKIPYDPQQVGHCYERLKEMLPVYQKGISRIRAEMESGRPFHQRLDKLLSLHDSILETGQGQKTSHSWIEEDVYLCCLYDMLEAMYAMEAEKILRSDGLTAQKKKNLEELSRSIEDLPFGSPQYRTGIRPRLESVISSCVKQLDT
jgi:hypothetical protein